MPPDPRNLGLRFPSTNQGNQVHRQLLYRILLIQIPCETALRSEEDLHKAWDIWIFLDYGSHESPFWEFYLTSRHLMSFAGVVIPGHLPPILLETSEDRATQRGICQNIPKVDPWSMNGVLLNACDLPTLSGLAFCLRVICVMAWSVGQFVDLCFCISMFLVYTFQSSSISVNWTVNQAILSTPRPSSLFWRKAHGGN